MMIEVRMTMEELDQIKKQEYKLGEDNGVKAAIRHIRWLMTSIPTSDRLIFKDEEHEKKYEEIRKFIKEAHNGNKA